MDDSNNGKDDDEDYDDDDDCLLIALLPSLLASVLQLTGNDLVISIVVSGQSDTVNTAGLHVRVVNLPLAEI